ncbi:MAG: sulfatase-like hydrolase/transferase [Chitinophagaceae bacterium]|nr:sulfatase-like hydrolase/transferase [Chitinophagaceae bacterium]
MQKLRKIPLFLFLLVLFFCLHGSVENYGYLHAKEVALVALIIMVCMAIFFGLVWVMCRNYLFASLLTFFVGVWYLFFGAFHDMIKSSAVLRFMQSFSVLLPVLLVVNIAVIWWLRKNRQHYHKLFLYLNLLFLFFCVFDGAMLLVRGLRYKETALTNPVPFDNQLVTKKPNIYFLLFDEYAGYKSLRDSFNFKNDSLYQFLQQRRFTELPVFANYDFTPFSMSSILNMQYVPENYRKALLTQPDIQNRFGEIRNAQVLTIFRSLGYRVENYSIFDIKDYPALFESNGLFPIHAGLLTNKIFHNRLIKGIGWRLVTGRFEIPFLKKYYMYRKDRYNKDVESSVLKSAGNHSNNPKFCYAHFLLPHGQFYRDSAGAYNQPKQIMNDEYLADKSLYLAYLKYTNNIIKQLLDTIIAKDPGAVIVVMSDHGFYDYENPGDNDPYNYDNICFLRSPAVDSGVYGLPKSNVNFFRYLFNTGFGQRLPYLPDSTIHVIEDPIILR